MQGGASHGATLTGFTVAPMIALAALAVAASAALFWFGPAPQAAADD
jgi:hypothetical protein